MESIQLVPVPDHECPEIVVCMGEVIGHRNRALRPPHPGGMFLMKIAVVLLSALLALSGCNTVQGMGRDLSAAGDAMSDTAGDVKNRM